MDQRHIILLSCPKLWRRQGVSNGGTASALSENMSLLTIPACRGLFDGDETKINIQPALKGGCYLKLAKK
jgi:hypothetical protein